MAVKENGQVVYNWNGSSSDVKPTSGVPEGSTFHVVDTGKMYFFHNDMWVPDLRVMWAMQNVTNFTS